MQLDARFASTPDAEAQQVAANVSDVQQGATRTGAASSQVLPAAKSLSAQSASLKTEMHKFLETVRAA